ncbi:MAG: hypothetical protein HY080_15295 [Gammaproteobacteria bacterium]|nr:hypothetical protein [Gammaproteobacteria bacterium]
MGVKNSPRLDKVRVPPRPPGATTEIQIFTRNRRAWVKAGTGGISLFDGKNPRLDGTHWWYIPANSQIPTGLKITKNHTDRITGLTHYRIEPVFDLPLDHFVGLLGVFARDAKEAFSTTNKHKVEES